MKQAIVIIIVSSVIALAVNMVSPNKIPLVDIYPEMHEGEKPIVPPDSDPTDPPFIAVSLAELDFMTGASIFIDAREESEFRCGTIPGAINISFDYLPEGDNDVLAAYLDSCLGGAALDTRMITFCSGEECDVSLHLARNLQALGYTNLAIFYGGSREWERQGKQIERRDQCGD